MNQLEHLSASSINLFLRCPRQFQEQYVLGKRGPSNSSLVIGSAVHLGLSRILKGEDVGDFFNEAVAKGEQESESIEWKDSPDRAKAIAEAHLYHYWEEIGKFLNVEDTEQELLLDIGLDIPLLGYVDIVLAGGSTIDVKTTGYLNRNVRLNKEWKLQANIYQIKHKAPAEFHVLTRAKNDPIIVPDSPNHALYVAPANPEGMMVWIRDIYGVMNYYYSRFGPEDPWPGNKTHEWAAKYCRVENCCQRS